MLKKKIGKEEGYGVYMIVLTSVTTAILTALTYSIGKNVGKMKVYDEIDKMSEMCEDFLGIKNDE